MWSIHAETKLGDGSPKYFRRCQACGRRQACKRRQNRGQQQSFGRQLPPLLPSQKTLVQISNSGALFVTFYVCPIL